MKSINDINDSTLNSMRLSFDISDNAGPPKNAITKYGMTYWHRNPSNTDEFVKQRYQLRPIGLGRISPLRQRLQIIVGGLWVKRSPEQNEQILHPILKYLIQKQIQFDRLEYMKATLYEANMLRDWQLLDRGVNENMRDLNSNINRFIHNKLYSFSTKIQDRSKGRLQKYQKYLQNIKNIKAQYQKQFIHLFEKGKVPVSCCNSSTSREEQKNYIDVIWNNVDAIEVFNKQEQLKKFNHMIKKNIDYFGCARLDDSSDILIRKYTKLKVPLLHTVEDHVFLQSASKNNPENSITLIKDICSQLYKYHQTLSTQLSKEYYNWINPANIIFDQAQLKPRLSFEPFICEALGLKNRPLSFENILTLFPTPKYFDFFQSEEEVSEIEELILLDDPNAGINDLILEDKNERQHYKDIKKNMQRIGELKQKITVWRFLLLSYYILNGKVFGQERKVQPIQEVKENFKRKLQYRRQEILKDSRNLNEFTGQDKKENELFQWNFKGLLDHLNIQREDDLVSSFKYQKIKSYRNLRALLLRQICKIYISTQIFQRMINVKKFLCMFGILSFQIIEETKNILQGSLQRENERKKMRKMVAREVKQLSNNKQYYEYINTTFNKLQSYTQRNSSDSQTRYLTHDQTGIKSYKITQELKKSVDRFISARQQLNHLEDLLQELEGSDNREQLKKLHDRKSAELKEMLEKEEGQIKKQCYQLVQTEMKEAIVEKVVHKFPDNHYKTRENYNLFTKRFICMLDAYFSLDMSNAYNYESLIIPLLKLQDEKRFQLKMIHDEVQIESEIANLKIINEIISAQKRNQNR